MSRVLLFAGVLGLALATASCSRSADQYFASGNRYLQNKQYKEAIVEYRNAVQKDPNHGQARLRLAEACAATGDVRNAYRESVRAADLLPASVEAQLRAGTFLLAA